MLRTVEQDLKNWKEQPNRMPLLVRGARQVGKSYVIEKFGAAEFADVVTLNFELHPEYAACFRTLEPTEIINSIQLTTGRSIIPGKTLLFLDEIQGCPNAILAMRYFKEKLPELAVIGSGSLLEFTLNSPEFRMPVGRVQFLFLKPLSFKEYLNASGNTLLSEYLEQIDLNTEISEVIHHKLLNLVREYMVLGGLPAVIQEYLVSKNINACQQLQNNLLLAYRNDFGKYAKYSGHKYLQRLFEKVPGLIGQNFKYNKVDPDMRSRDIKSALDMLVDAGLIYRVQSAAASGIPLISQVNEKKFKILFLDIGLVNRASSLQADILLQEDILLVNRGILAEQLVGQELLAHTSRDEPGHLFFWEREKKNSTAEIDYMININENIIPIEVKAGTTGRLKSLQIFMAEKKSKLGVRISQQPLELDNKVLSLPVYLISELKRLLLNLL